MARRPVLQPRSICVLIFGDFQLLDPKVQASVRALLADTGITPAKAVERLRLASGPSIPPGRSRWWPAASASATPKRMRRAFVRAFGHPPQAPRRMARA